MLSTNRLHLFLKQYQSFLPPEAVNELSVIADEYCYLKEIFNHSDWTISLIDKDGKYLITNPKMEHLVGNIVGQKIGSLSKDNEIQSIINILKTTGKDQHSEVINSVLGNVKKTFLLQVTKISDKFLIMGSDITEFQELKKQQEFNDRMIMLGEMSSFIVHEINNPLNSISLSAELISILTKDQKIQENTNRIANMIQVISKIILTLKSFSRKNDDEEKTLVNFKSLFDQAELIIKPKIKIQNIMLSSDIDESELFGNEIEFLQVLVNLISNAIDAVKDLDQRWIKVIWKNGHLSVIDSGNGVDSKVIPRLFEKFHTTKGSHGNGIGLYLSKEILDKNGYDLQYQKIDNHTAFVWSKKNVA